MSPALRDLGLSDLQRLLGLYADLHPNDDALPARDVVEQTWAAIVADPRQIYIGAFLDDELVSTCAAAIVPNLTRGARPYAVIENVVTASAFRRHGYGSRVVQEALRRCWAQGCYKVMLLSGMQRGDVHAFYDANGFDRTAKQAFVINAR